MAGCPSSRASVWRYRSACWLSLVGAFESHDSVDVVDSPSAALRSRFLVFDSLLMDAAFAANAATADAAATSSFVT